VTLGGEPPGRHIAAVGRPESSGGWKKRGATVQATKAAILLCMAMATGVGTWYLRVRIPDNQWRRPSEAGRRSMERGHFGEAERQFAMAVEAARAFGNRDLRLARSLFDQAQALVAQNKRAEAIRVLEQALAIQEKAHGPEHHETVFVFRYYTHLVNGSGRAASAEAAARGGR
jgi:hypothetical protein